MRKKKANNVTVRFVGDKENGQCAKGEGFLCKKFLFSFSREDNCFHFTTTRAEFH